MSVISTVFLVLAGIIAFGAAVMALAEAMVDDESLNATESGEAGSLYASDDRA